MSDLKHFVLFSDIKMLIINKVSELEENFILHLPQYFEVMIKYSMNKRTPPGF